MPVSYCRMVKESTWGTDPGTGYTEIPLMEDAVQLTVENQYWVPLLNSSYPNTAFTDLNGRSIGVSLNTPIWPEIHAHVQDFVERAAGNVLNSWTFHRSYGLTGESYPAYKVLGCKPNSIAIASSEDGPVILTGDFIGKSAAAISTFTGTPSPTLALKSEHTTVALDASGTPKTLVDIVGTSVNWAIDLDVGPFDNDGQVAFIEDGFTTATFSIAFRKDANTWMTHLLSSAAYYDQTITITWYSTSGASGTSKLEFAATNAALQTAPTAGTEGGRKLTTVIGIVKGAWTLT